MNIHICSAKFTWCEFFQAPKIALCKDPVYSALDTWSQLYISNILVNISYCLADTFENSDFIKNLAPTCNMNETRNSLLNRSTHNALISGELMYSDWCIVKPKGVSTLVLFLWRFFCDYFFLWHTYLHIANSKLKCCTVVEILVLCLMNTCSFPFIEGPCVHCGIMKSRK